MKVMKTFGTAAVGGVLAMALAVPALATIPTSPSGTVYTSTVAARSEGILTLHNSSVGISASFEEELEGKIESHGSSTTTTIKLTKKKPSSSSSSVFHVKKPGHLTIHGLIPPSVTWDGGEMEVTYESIGINCVYTSSGTLIGTLTTGSLATIDVNSAKIPRTGGSVFCGSSGTLTGSYKINTPSSFYVD